MPKSVEYKTKLVTISAVELQGHLSYRDGGWYVGNDGLDEWLDKFSARYISLAIKDFERDESHLLPQAGEPS